MFRGFDEGEYEARDVQGFEERRRGVPSGRAPAEGSLKFSAGGLGRNGVLLGAWLDADFHELFLGRSGKSPQSQFRLFFSE